MKKRCKDNCPYREIFGLQDAQKFQKLKCQDKPKLMGEMLSDPNTTEEIKWPLQEWLAESSSSKCQAVFLNELIFFDTWGPFGTCV